MQPEKKNSKNFSKFLSKKPAEKFPTAVIDQRQSHSLWWCYANPQCHRAQRFSPALKVMGRKSDRFSWLQKENLSVYGDEITDLVFNDLFTKSSFVLFAGCLATAGALTYGLIAFKRGETRQSQFLMRTRIAAQGFTIAAIMFGVVLAATKSKPN